MNETKLGPNGETIDQDGEVIARPMGWRRAWAATEGIRPIILCAGVVLVGVVLMTLIGGS